MSGPNEQTTRQGIERAAQDIRTAAEKAGRPMTQAQAETRVREAVREGDRKRENNNR